MSKIADLFKQAGIEPEILKEIEDAFDAQVETRVTERVKNEVDSAVALTETNNKKLFKEAVDLIEQTHQTQLTALEDEAIAEVEKLIEGHQKTLTVTALEHRNELESLTSDFLDAKLEEVIPTSILEAAAKNNEAARILEAVRNTIGLDRTIIKENVRTALTEGDRVIRELEQEVVALKKKAALAESIALLESKTAQLPADKRDHIKSVLAGKSPKFIAENFDDVSNIYERQVKRTRSEAQEGTVRRSRTSQVDRPVVTSEADDNTATTITEQTDNNSAVDGYLAALASKR